MLQRVSLMKYHSYADSYELKGVEFTYTGRPPPPA